MSRCGVVLFCIVQSGWFFKNLDPAKNDGMTREREREKEKNCNIPLHPKTMERSNEITVALYNHQLDLLRFQVLI